jgi:acyl-[acyl-carrier-protein]-phospholipid O-acyltransferase/long-chain-fatty-acid--[acyl-carrier-protein] ligase
LPKRDRLDWPVWAEVRAVRACRIVAAEQPDAPILHASMPAHTTYAIDTAMSQQWWIKPFLRFVDWHSIDPTRPMGMRDLINAVKSGEQLVIFPEGRLSTTGSLMKVYDGTALIADKADAVVVPVRIEGPERAKGWSYLRPSQIVKAWFPKTTLTILPPVKLSISPDLRGKARRQAAGAALQDIMTTAVFQTAPVETTLFRAIVDARRTYDTKKPIIEDPLGTKLSYGRLILGAQVLGAKIAPLSKTGEAVGLMLPNSAGAAVTFMALQTTGRVPAMLNFTAGPRNVIAACRAAQISTILTSRVFIDKGRLGDLVAALEAERLKIVYLDDVRPTITTGDKLAGMRRRGRPQVERKPDDPAVILFTSGSEGLPKGVVLSHCNILSNAYQALARVDVNAEDKVFNALPMFHSFGLTAGFLMGPLRGIPVHLYPTPLHYRIVPELTYQTNATILFGTDTFLNGYARSAHPYDLAKVRYVLAGAEPVRDRTRALYMEKFGVRILEGYGVTECAPVVALNTPFANRTGTVGRLVPNMEYRIEPVPGVTEGGRLFLKGPNVMLGYYRAEKPGILEPPHQGWHDTGDIVTFDADGYIAIRGRAKRFAKVGGEMISLAAVEALAAELWPNTMSVVVTEPDPRKGERLVLLVADGRCQRSEFGQFARSRGASELMVPAEVMAVDKVPLLGSGKPDFPAAARLLAERRAAAAKSDGHAAANGADASATQTAADAQATAVPVAPAV